jgi:hypothetical protein
MPKSKKTISILHDVGKLYLQEEKKLASSKEWIDFFKSHDRFRKTAFKRALPFDPRFNSVHWGFAVSGLCREISFSYCWMNAYARYYKDQVKQGTQPAHVDFHVSYFADNCITRIDSCRDKLALMVWAFYCPFNPEKRSETLDYNSVKERLKYPLRFGLTLKNHDLFLNHLEALKGMDFDRIERFRNYKVHRMEPRIEIYGVKPHHGWDYMFPLYEEKEIREWEKKLESQYPEKQFREHIKKGCYINGVLFDQRKIIDSLWEFDEVCGHIESSMKKLFKASAGCLIVLTRRSPLIKQPRSQQRSGGFAKP